MSDAPEFTESELNDPLYADLAEEIQANGPEKTVIVAILCDRSGSMATPTLDGGGTKRPRHEGVQAGLEAVLQHCQAVPYRRQSTLIGIGTFGPGVDFSGFGKVDQVNIPLLTPSGSTPLAGALDLALDALQEVVSRLDDEERRFSIPNLCIVSDGAPDQTRDLTKAIERTSRLVDGGDLNVSLVGIDQDDCRRLQSLGLNGHTFAVSEVAWEDVIREATFGGGGTARVGRKG